MRMARGDRVMSFQTMRYKRVFSVGEKLSTASMLRLIQGRRNADLAKKTAKDLSRLLMPEVIRPSEKAALARNQMWELWYNC
ncbi:MAG: hypothetical protein RL018_1411 [Pseudomonadota bacterium]|jgi:hypothetical protein